MFYFNLKGNEEDLFRQGMAGPEHIVLNGYEFWEIWDAAIANNREGTYTNLRFDTLCGRNLKYNDEYSRFRSHSGPIRNCCEYCATEYEPDGPTYKERAADKYKRDSGDLPF